jgi:Leucine-rich repeat (LRR) protein
MRFLLFFLCSTFTVLAQEEFIYKNLETALANPNQVYHLQLKRKGFTEFPNELNLFPNLIKLDLSKNKIKSFPDSLAHLSSLKVLRLSRNEIEYIPKNIAFLEALEELDLWDNYISELPEAIINLKHLKSVDIRGIALSYTKYNAYLEMMNGVDLFMSEPCDCMEDK